MVSTVADMPALYQAPAVVTVTNTPSAFGDYSYPIKLYEAMACGRPVVASRTASTAHGICRRLRDFPDRLVAPGDAAVLAGALAAALDLGAVDYGAQPGWGASGAQLEAAMPGDWGAIIVLVGARLRRAIIAQRSCATTVGVGGPPSGRMDEPKLRGGGAAPTGAPLPQQK